MFSSREASRVAKEANKPEGAELDNEDMSSDPVIVEVRIDAKLKEAAERGELGCYFGWEEMGKDPDGMAEKYRQNGWEVYYNDKIDSWCFRVEEAWEDSDC